MAFYIKNKEGQILTSGGYLEVGEGLRVEEGALKANEGIDIDAELKTDSTNPVQNQVITQRLQEIDLVTAAALNDLNDKKADRSQLAQVAFTGDYNDLDNTLIAGTNITIENGVISAAGGGGSDFDASRIKAGDYIILTYLDQNEQEVQSPQNAYYVKIDANIPAMEETISQWERVVANALARHEQAIQELQNA